MGEIIVEIDARLLLNSAPLRLLFLSLSLSLSLHFHVGHGELERGEESGQQTGV